eukprot:NODE_15316_length_1056_cov_7.637244.p4 GENE.NODE_15316_length_1056_cov_7.637244~~NODE_15316_length_1056_cov_7.637244.p4  ORF type:complete len:93 (-),score=34.34 NODE_15316_length_1056_cov_7.637244:112-390(-)
MSSEPLACKLARLLGEARIKLLSYAQVVLTTSCCCTALTCTAPTHGSSIQAASWRLALNGDGGHALFCSRCCLLLPKSKKKKKKKKKKNPPS